MSSHRLSFALVTALLWAIAPAAFAAPAAYIVQDHSNDSLMDEPTAKALWKENLPLAMSKLYPMGKWGFLSEVEGGFDENKVCVVTARAMLMPRSGKFLLFRPSKTATAYGIQSGATPAQCKALGKAKLGEAIAAVRYALLPR